MSLSWGHGLGSGTTLGRTEPAHSVNDVRIQAERDGRGNACLPQQLPEGLLTEAADGTEQGRYLLVGQRHRRLS